MVGWPNCDPTTIPPPLPVSRKILGGNRKTEMSSNTDEGEIIRVSKKGQATIPKELREKFGMETPGRVYIHEEDGQIVVEPLPSVSEMQGIHAGRYETGEVLQHLQEMTAEDKRLERESDKRLQRDR